MVQAPATHVSSGAGCERWVAGRLGEQHGLGARLRRTHVSAAWEKAKRLRQTPGATLVIMALIPVRMLADRLWSSSILSYQPLASRLWKLMVAYTPHGCLLNGDWSDTVGCTPHIYTLYKGMHDGLCTVCGPRGT